VRHTNAVLQFEHAPRNARRGPEQDLKFTTPHKLQNVMRLFPGKFQIVDKARLMYGVCAGVAHHALHCVGRCAHKTFCASAPATEAAWTASEISEAVISSAHVLIFQRRLVRWT